MHAGPHPVGKTLTMTGGGRSPTDAPLTAIWDALRDGIVVVGIGFAIRFRGGKWQAMSVIERHVDDEAEEPDPAGPQADAACPAVAGETC